MVKKIRNILNLVLFVGFRNAILADFFKVPQHEYLALNIRHTLKITFKKKITTNKIARFYTRPLTQQWVTIIKLDIIWKNTTPTGKTIKQKWQPQSRFTPIRFSFDPWRAVRPDAFCLHPYWHVLHGLIVQWMRLKLWWFLVWKQFKCEKLCTLITRYIGSLLLTQIFRGYTSGALASLHKEKTFYKAGEIL